ncbi:DUF1501 domain-containing protein [Tautonia sociabilis]|uniref:DUF1501 domain-containing protein n=1 Tax=Tautonia sociabilis TaxID=2080755 RepID=A0A432MJZ4_9BACT|nr:DUF1501 domain-containing protein [Tautonia sociabilis]RUL87505.1 DUF1501 domain-containing protein [Tautonia sociabilis]
MPAPDSIHVPSRRDWFRQMGRGIGASALASLLADEFSPRRARGADGIGDALGLSPRPPHHPPRAKSIIQLFMPGGPSSIDLFDPKPLVARYEGKPYPGVVDTLVPSNAGNLMPSPFRFSRHGESGIEVSELMPHLATCADLLTVVRSMKTEHLNHEPAIWMFNTGRITPGHPSMGSWFVYGLGTENQDLPAYVALDDPAGMPIDGIRNWSAGWLPPIYQGTRIRSEGAPLPNLSPAFGGPEAAGRNRLRLLAEMAEEHRLARPGEAELDARLASYELAARMQLSATAALDIESEPEETRRLYGLDDEVTASYGRRCLMARRLVERGVRFVQIFMEGAVWDHHGQINAGLRKECARVDRPTAGLLLDLHRRGLLEDAVVLWGGEFGRLPISENADGRDHNPLGFTIWMAGGGLKPGHIHGATDEFGYKAVEGQVTVPDLHATLLHLLGLDHSRLTYPVHGLDEGLISTLYEARVVEEILA